MEKTVVTHYFAHCTKCAGMTKFTVYIDKSEVFTQVVVECSTCNHKTKTKV